MTRFGVAVSISRKSTIKHQGTTRRLNCTSSDLQMSRKRPDHYYWKAKEEGYPSRAAYKLQQINERFRILKPGQVVVDLCGAPGGFAVLAAKAVASKGRVFVVDQQPLGIKSPWIVAIQGDITNEETVQRLLSQIATYHSESGSGGSGADVVLADCAPCVMGSWSTDHARQIFLSENALHIAMDLKAKIFVCKVFDGDLLSDFLKECKESYSSVKLTKPPASRPTAAERFVVARGPKRIQ
jgi:23S rRNA (uridine2552-2'-O)-methyltransferase